jgi:hypothetical protein
MFVSAKSFKAHAILLSIRLHFLVAVLNKPMHGLYLQFVIRPKLTFRWRRLCARCSLKKFQNQTYKLSRNFVSLNKNVSGFRFFSAKNQKSFRF